MKSILLFAAALVILAPSMAWGFCDDWHTDDTVMGATWSVLAIQDGLQTRQACAKQSGECELNPLLGSSPSPDSINKAVATSLAIGWGLACILPHEWRIIGFSFAAGVEASSVHRNYLLGFTGGF